MSNSRRSNVKKKKLSPYRRLQWDLEHARHQVVVAADTYTKEHIALIDALAFFDRVAASKTEWTASDVKRLAEIRKLAAAT